jgi:hypothetical protein
VFIGLEASLITIPKSDKFTQVYQVAVLTNICQVVQMFSGENSFSAQRLYSTPLLIALIIFAGVPSVIK